MAVADLGVDTGQIADDAVTSIKIEDQAITLPKLANGTAAGQLLQWDGTNWVYITEADISATAVEVDGIIGNEVTDVTNGTLVRSGTGTGADPYTLAVADLGVDTGQIADDAVTTVKILDENVTVQKINPSSTDGQVLTTITGNVQWADPASAITGTAGSIFFAGDDGGGTGEPTENNAQLYWDGANMSIGLVSRPLTNKLSVDGSTRTSGLNNSPGSAGVPSYRFSDNASTGMFLADASGVLGFSANNIEAIRIDATQNVGIGPTFAGGTAIAARLHVDGDIRGDDIYSNGILIPDYVFQKYFLGNSDLKESYDFQTLAQIEAFIKANHHLPGIKSAEEVKLDGFWNLSESNLQNLEKIEELFLHTIEQEKKIDQLKTENESLSAELQSLRKDMDEIKALLQNKN